MLGVEEALAPVFAGTKRDVTEENIQARARGIILMAISNKFGLMVVTTGNKSEMSVGYATLYGDMAGGFAVLKDVFKGWTYASTPGLNAMEHPIYDVWVVSCNDGTGLARPELTYVPDTAVPEGGEGAGQPRTGGDPSGQLGALAAGAVPDDGRGGGGAQGGEQGFDVGEGAVGHARHGSGPDRASSV